MSSSTALSASRAKGLRFTFLGFAFGAICVALLTLKHHYISSEWSAMILGVTKLVVFVYVGWSAWSARDEGGQFQHNLPLRLGLGAFVISMAADLEYLNAHH
jgi:hypothetical protein